MLNITEIQMNALEAFYGGGAVRPYPGMENLGKHPVNRSSARRIEMAVSVRFFWNSKNDLSGT
jgi:hypothetical protein